MSLVDNKKAGFNYEIGDKYEAGIELSGGEVKAIRQGHGQLDGSTIKIRGGEAFLAGATIPPYQPDNTPKNYEPARTRKLLLTHPELKTLIGLDKEKGLTLVPLALYNKGRRIKLSFGVAKHKKKYDKRETIKRQDSDREMARTLKNKR